jgi:tRNA G18 (ribose-2'-O)-methylase SpoU
MHLTFISDIHLPELQIYQQLRDNFFREDNSFIADSSKVINKILEQAIEVKSILATEEYYKEFKYLIEDKNIPILYVATKKLMESIIGHKLHHNVMLHGIRPSQTSLENLDDNIIMLDEITSSENLGSIARSAAALGINSCLLPKQGPHPFGRRALRVSMGHMALLKTHLYDNIVSTLKALKIMGYTLYGAEITKNSIPLSKITINKKWVLLMGHEGHGLSKEVLELCDYIVHIEMMPNIKSFNVAVASSILMYTFSQKQTVSHT